MGTDEHRERAPKSIGFGVVTVSDTRAESDDVSGMAIIETMKAAGHKFIRKMIVKDETDQIQGAFRELLEDKEVNAVVATGGTGVSKRDVTLEAASHFEEKLLPGFGELFRMLSFEEVGSAAMMSRATAFVTEGKVVFCLPGSEKAVRLATTRLIAPEVAHMVWEANR
jgi:molybdenum cofactor biosynthesis protein B